MTNTESNRQSAAITVTHPELVHRLVDPDDSNTPARSHKRVQVWCDGTVQAKPAHARTEYSQQVASVTDGRNGCPVCARTINPTSEVGN